MDYLNEKYYKVFYYIGFGIDLIIEFLEKYVWVGVGSLNEKNVLFMVNILIEEVFIMLFKIGVNG